MTEEKKEVYADWELQLWVNCPHCNEYQDIAHNYLQELRESVAPLTSRDISCYNFMIECEECKKEFKVTNVRD